MISLDFNKNSNFDKMDIYALLKLTSVFILMLFSGVIKGNINIKKVEQCFNNPFGRILYLLLVSSTVFNFSVNKPYEHYTEMFILTGILYFFIYVLEQIFPKKN